MNYELVKSLSLAVDIDSLIEIAIKINLENKDVLITEER